MKAPELSVCIPTYNAAHFLPETIGSVMRQGLTDFEIVIVDNASQDHTETLVRSFANPHIRYFRHTENLGPHKSFARALAEARGEYFKPLCADDVLLEGVLIKQLEILRQRSDVALVGSDTLVTDSKLNIQRRWRFLHGSCSEFRMKNACLTGVTNYIGGPSNIMFRRSASLGVISDPTYSAVADLKFALQILKNGRYASIDEPGYLYRRHPHSDTVVGCTTDMHRFEPMRLVDEYDWWNPFNCLLAIRRGGVHWTQAVTKRWWRACLPQRIFHSLIGSYDVLRLYKQYRADMRNGARSVIFVDNRNEARERS
jgi:glycosyltransferase involved in cell wall biosynthesis